MDRMTAYDRRGVPIRPGDVLKVYHFRGWSRYGGRRTYWMHKLVVAREGGLCALNVSDIAARGVGGAHEWRLWASRDADGFLPIVEVVGSATETGPNGEALDWSDRDRVKRGVVTG